MTVAQSATTAGPDLSSPSVGVFQLDVSEKPGHLGDHAKRGVILHPSAFILGVTG
jgi:hypothetical protein